MSFEESNIIDVNQESRMLMLFGEINESSSFGVTQGLLELQAMDPMKDISFIINSHGGHIDDCLAIIDVMNCIKPDIRTIVIGKAMSAGAFIAINGTKGKRYITENSRLMLHSLSTSVSGSFNDIQVDIEEVTRLNDKLIDIISTNAKLSKKDVKDLIKRDRYILPQEAIEFGLLDGIVKSIQ